MMIWIPIRLKTLAAMNLISIAPRRQQGRVVQWTKSSGHADGDHAKNQKNEIWETFVQNNTQHRRARENITLYDSLVIFHRATICRRLAVSTC
jgi:hypothetical protein